MAIEYDFGDDYRCEKLEKIARLRNWAKLASSTHKLYKIAELLRGFDDDEASKLFAIANHIDAAFDLMRVPPYPKGFDQG